MPDREKVIKGLECCMSESLCYKCPYKDKDECEDGSYYYSKAIEDAIELLRAQDQSDKPREERHEVTINHVWGDDVEVWSEFYCPHCGAMIAKGNSEHYPRCMWCGKKVNWV